METLTRIIPTLEALTREAQAFLEALVPEPGAATLITLSGDLGAGKTSFTQQVAAALGVEDVVNSPTFVIEKVYGIPEGEAYPEGNKYSRLVHIDAYRLQNISELTSLGFGELMSHPRTLIMLEWPEQVPGIDEQAAVRILLEALPDGSRQITYA